MQKFFTVLFVTLFASVSFAAPVVNFIEFQPIAAVPDGYSFGISEIKIDKRTVYTLSFKKGGNIFALTPENVFKGRYPELYYTGLAINKNIVIIGGKEQNKSNASWVFMFDISKDKVRLLDIITKAQINENTFNFEYQLPSIDAPRALEDIDRDKRKEFTLDFYDYSIYLYAEINKNRINIDYSSSVYNKIFNTLDMLPDKDEYQFMQYIIYGTLAKRFNRVQAEKIYLNYIGESNSKLRQLTANMHRIKELTDTHNLTNKIIEYLSRDIEEKELLEIISSIKDSKEYKQRIQLLDEQLKLLHADEVILNDFAAYIGGYVTKKEFDYILTKSVEPSYKNVKVLLSNIFILDNIIHKYGYKIIYLKADV